MAKEKETSACTGPLASLENHIPVVLWTETCEDNVRRDSIALLNALEVEWRVHIYLDHRVNSDLALVDLALVLQLLFSLGQTVGLTSKRAVILNEVLHLHHVPDGWILNLDLIQLNLAFVDAALNLAILLTTAALFNSLELLGKLLDATEDNVDQLNVEARGEEGVESLLNLLLAIFLLAAESLPHHLLKCLPDKRL